MFHFLGAPQGALEFHVGPACLAVAAAVEDFATAPMVQTGKAAKPPFQGLLLFPCGGKDFFDKMDDDKNGEVSKDEAVKFWGKNFAKVNATSMFNEVDEDGNGSVTWEEFLAFWKNVVASGYPPEDISDEIDLMMEGGSWVDFNDGRTT